MKLCGLVYGEGKWKVILSDPQFGPALSNRSNIDLKQKFDVPENFKRSMTSKLRRLVFTGELEKVDNRYKYKGVSSGFETSQQLVAIPYNVDNSVAQTTQKSIANPADRETLEDAAMVVARKISITENLEQEAIKACEKADKIAELLDESLVMLKLAKELHERCSRGKTLVLKS